MKNDYDEIDEIYSIEFVYSKETSSIMLGGGNNRIYTYDLHHEQVLDCFVSSVGAAKDVLTTSIINSLLPSFSRN